MLIFEDVEKSYPGPNGTRVPVLKKACFALEPGTLAIIQGPSGCGKSTLLFTAGAMLPPDGGRVKFNSQSVYGLSHVRRNAFRGNTVGFIFQKFHLVPYLDVADNILWPLRWNREADRHAADLPAVARRLGIDHRLAHKPARLSVGEQQRVAVARALLGGKSLLCADEPTGNLDEENAALVLEVLREEAGRGSIVLLVTHQKRLAGVGAVHFRFGPAGLERTGDPESKKTGAGNGGGT